MVIVGVFIVFYGYFFYDKIVNLGGFVDNIDKWFVFVGLIFLFEVVCCVFGLVMVIIVMIFLMYVFFGLFIVVLDVICWGGVLLKKVMSYMWIIFEGVFGIVFGVFMKFVFFFVLFGVFLDKVGVGNYFIKMVFGVFGYFKGGFVKVVVVGFVVIGFIFGFFIVNVVIIGIFMILLMKCVGFSFE